jgi:WD40 repeat protein
MKKKIIKKNNSNKYKFKEKYYNLYELANIFLQEENFELAQEHIEKGYIDEYLHKILRFDLSMEYQYIPVLNKLIYFVYSLDENLDFILYGKVINKKYILQLVSKKISNNLNKIEEKIFNIIFNKDFLDLIDIYENQTKKTTYLKHLIQIDDENLAKAYLSLFDFEYLVNILKNSFGFTLYKTLKGHNDVIFTLAISHNDKYIVSGSMDSTIKVWNMKNGKYLKTLEGHKLVVESVAITSDDKYIVSGSWDKTIKIWNKRNGKCLRTLEGHNDYVLSVVISSEDEFIVSGSRDGTIKIWDFETGECLKTIEDEWEASVTAVAIGKNDEYVLSGNSFGIITIWDIEIGKSLETIEERDDFIIEKLIITSDNEYILSQTGDSIKKFDINSGECVATIFSRTNYDDFLINSVTITNDNKYVIYGNNNATITIYDIESFAEVQVLEEYNHNYSLDISNDNNFMISDKDKMIRIWKNNGNNIEYIEKNIKLLEFDTAMKLINEEIINLDNVIHNLLEIGDFKFLGKIVEYFESSNYREKFISQIRKLQIILITG